MQIFPGKIALIGSLVYSWRSLPNSPTPYLSTRLPRELESKNLLASNIPQKDSETTLRLWHVWLICVYTCQYWRPFIRHQWKVVHLKNLLECKSLLNEHISTHTDILQIYSMEFKLHI